jgi:hypothetical protein
MLISIQNTTSSRENHELISQVFDETRNLAIPTLIPILWIW